MTRSLKIIKFQLVNSYFIYLFLFSYNKSSVKFVSSFKLERLAPKFKAPSAPIGFDLFFSQRRIDYMSVKKVIEYKNHFRYIASEFNDYFLKIIIQEIEK